VPVLARKFGALRNGAPIKDWVLPAAMERVRRKLASADDGNRQMVDILTAVLTDGLPTVEAACAEATAGRPLIRSGASSSTLELIKHKRVLPPPREPPRAKTAFPLSLDFEAWSTRDFRGERGFAGYTAE
jgi:hypothetical protein